MRRLSIYKSELIFGDHHPLGPSTKELPLDGIWGCDWLSNTMSFCRTCHVYLTRWILDGTKVLKDRKGLPLMGKWLVIVVKRSSGLGRCLLPGSAETLKQRLFLSLYVYTYVHTHIYIYIF